MSNMQNAFIEVVEKFGIKVDAGQPHRLRYIPREWVEEFIDYIISAIKVKPKLIDKRDNRFTLYFNTNDQAEKFFREFESTTLEKLNYFISQIKKDDPSKYARNLVVESVISNSIVHLSY
ncbi:MAG: hypothetical protein QW835_00315 [Candidatus Hadarchaeum sp.]